MWSLAGSQAVDQPIWCSVSESSGAGQSAALGLCVGQLSSAPVEHPPEVLGVGALPGFQVWVPSPLIWVHVTRLQVSTGAAYPSFTVQGFREEGAPEAVAAADSSLTSC